ncbi:MAG: transcriptional regulator [Desulfobulbaceae bacterium]|nr:transcriptional regulator [Desulfobulbaceae bacterium]
MILTKTRPSQILDGVKEIKSFHKGQKEQKTFTLSEPSPPKIIREKLKLSQVAFAGLLGVSSRTIQDWGQGRRQPQGTAKSLYRIAENHPEILAELR